MQGRREHVGLAEKVGDGDTKGLRKAAELVRIDAALGLFDLADPGEAVADVRGELGLRPAALLAGRGDVVANDAVAGGCAW